ncbi:MAG: hypothetical protein B0D91_09535 [Oceanospirillales bacterium LUC14_002_19_P2]|nr:MAG: hypothetical protein B0D91_09535 [Oceanospirillales bacterium LUC14_002_19_P2]
MVITYAGSGQSPILDHAFRLSSNNEPLTLRDHFKGHVILMTLLEPEANQEQLEALKQMFLRYRLRHFTVVGIHPETVQVTSNVSFPLLKLPTDSDHEHFQMLTGLAGPSGMTVCLVNRRGHQAAVFPDDPVPGNSKFMQKLEMLLAEHR